MIDAGQQDLRAETVGVGARLYRLKHGITSPDLARLKRKGYVPAEYADVILG